MTTCLLCDSTLQEIDRVPEGINGKMKDVVTSVCPRCFTEWFTIAPLTQFHPGSRAERSSNTMHDQRRRGAI